MNSSGQALGSAPMFAHQTEPQIWDLAMHGLDRWHQGIGMPILRALSRDSAFFLPPIGLTTSRGQETNA